MPYLRPKTVLSILKDTLAKWNADGAPRFAAALAYYTAFSIAPLLVFVIAISGLMLGRELVRIEIFRQLEQVLGDEGMRFVSDLIESVRNPGASLLATVLGLITLLFGAIGVFGEIQATLNLIWGVESKPPGIRQILRERFLAFTMVLGLSFLLLVSLIVSAVLAALGTLLNRWLPDLIPLQTINAVVSFVMITLLLAMIYRILPEVEIAWGDVWLGAAVTALLFTIGKHLIGLYLGNSGLTSAYGAAGSLVVILIWAYYSAQIFYFGAEFTQVYATKYRRSLPETAA